MDDEFDYTQRRASAPPPESWDPSGEWNPSGGWGGAGNTGRPYSGASAQPRRPSAGGPGRRPGSGPLLAVALAYLVVVALGVGLLTGAGRVWSAGSDGSAYPGNYGQLPTGTATPGTGAQGAACTAAPQLQVVGVRGSTSGLVVSVRATSSCRGGQTMTGVWQVRLSSAGTEVAAASFDFSSQPVSIPGGSSAQLDLTFTPGSYRAAPSSLSPSSMTLTGSGSASNGGGGGSSQASVTADGALAPASGSLDAASAAALQRQSSVDSATAVSRLSNVWSPQLSSKRPGLYADGVTYDNTAILNEYLSLKSKYPDALLLWSGDWPVFDSSNFWITMSGVPFSDPDAANDWCVQENFDRDHCFAKRLSKTGSSTGSTKLRPR